METQIVPFGERTLEASNIYGFVRKQMLLRQMSADEWIELYASGTLRKNKRIGFSWISQYRVERTAWEFGWEFCILPKTRVNFNDPITAGDCEAATESGWHIDRYIERAFFNEDIFQAKYIIAEGSLGKGHVQGRKEGIGILVKQTCASWIPKGYIIFAIIAEYNTNTKQFKESVNPF